MKTILTLFVLLFSPLVFADDISDFEIEGMSIGDSALKFFSESFIKDNEKNYYKNKKYTPVETELSSYELFDAVDFSYQTNDKNYVIESIIGVIFFINNIDECLFKKQLILEEFPPEYNFDNYESIHSFDNTSTFNQDTFYFYNGDTISITCYNYTEVSGYKDHLGIMYSTKKYEDFLRTAYD